MRLAQTVAVIALPFALWPASACQEEPPGQANPVVAPASHTAPPEQPPPPEMRRAMTQTERRAIAEARSRREASRPSTHTRDDPAAGGGEPSERSPGLTRHERQAARDDPAVHLPDDTPAPSVEEAELPSESSKVRTSPRPGVVLRSAASGLKLVDLAIATEVRQREPIGVSNRFVEMPRMFHCFCVFENRQEPSTVTHVWKRDGRVVSRVELEVGKSPKWRTWSRQRLQPTWTGEWSCEVQAPGGRVLGEATARSGP